MGRMQTMLGVLYPPRCLACGETVGREAGLCPTCWRDTPFITGVTCHLCGAPLPGEVTDHDETCDDCLTLARPWARGAAVLTYADGARRLILALKHGDRTDIAPAAGRWMAQAATGLPPDSVLVPVPIHWRRLFSRRFNQAALLAHGMARVGGWAVAPDALIRTRATQAHKGLSVEERFENMRDVITLRPRAAVDLMGRTVVLIDDVMTSGATLAAAAEAVQGADPADIQVLVLARATRTP